MGIVWVLGRIGIMDVTHAVTPGPLFEGDLRVCCCHLEILKTSEQGAHIFISLWALCGLSWFWGLDSLLVSLPTWEGARLYLAWKELRGAWWGQRGMREVAAPLSLQRPGAGVRPAVLKQACWTESDSGVRVLTLPRARGALLGRCWPSLSLFPRLQNGNTGTPAQVV